MRSLLLLGCLWLGLGVRVAQAAAPPAALTDTLHLNYEDSGLFGKYFAYCFEPCARPQAGERALALWQAGRFQRLPLANGVLQGGYRQDRLWLRVVVRNTLPQRSRFVWNLYSFLDSATLYKQAEGRGPLREAGRASSWVVAGRRPFPGRALCLPFWLEAGEQAVFYVRAETHAGSWYLPIDMSTPEGYLFFEQTYFAYAYWAWLLGLYVASALFNLVLYAFLRDRIHLWYGAYVFFSTWFLLMEDSIDALLLPQWLYGLGWRVGQLGMLLLALGCGLRILALFVRLRQGWPRLHRLSWALSGVAVGYALLHPLLCAGAGPPGSRTLAWLNEGREALVWLLLLAGALMLAVVAGRGRPPQRRLAALYASTYVFLLMGTAELLLNYAGHFYFDWVKPNALAWGLVIELLTLSVLLTARFRNAQRQTNELRVRQLRERATAGQRLIAAQDEEREALARELHDALAPSLTALHLVWQARQVRTALAEAAPLLTEAHTHTEALLRQLRRDVRTLSQVLLPSPTGEPPPLPEAVALLAETLNMADDGPRIGYHCDPAAAHLPAAVQQAAYRIVAELLHNALRHAQASQVQVLIDCQPGALQLEITDDGRGFDPSGPAPRQGGLGLRGVQARVSYLRGQVQVRSQRGQGTTVLVELPLA